MSASGRPCLGQCFSTCFFGGGTLSILQALTTFHRINKIISKIALCLISVTNYLQSLFNPSINSNFVNANSLLNGNLLLIDSQFDLIWVEMFNMTKNYVHEWIINVKEKMNGHTRTKVLRPRCHYKMVDLMSKARRCLDPTHNWNWLKTIFWFILHVHLHKLFIGLSENV